VVVAADTAAAVVDMVAVEVAVSTEGAEAFMVAWAEVDFVPADFAEVGHASLAADIEGADMVVDSAEVTVAMVAATAMVVDTADTVTTITDQVL
jgi:hypothetical protein